MAKMDMNPRNRNLIFASLINSVEYFCLQTLFTVSRSKNSFVDQTQFHCEMNEMTKNARTTEPVICGAHSLQWQACSARPGPHDSLSELRYVTGVYANNVRVRTVTLLVKSMSNPIRIDVDWVMRSVGGEWRFWIKTDTDETFSVLVSLVMGFGGNTYDDNIIAGRIIQAVFFFITVPWKLFSKKR